MKKQIDLRDVMLEATAEVQSLMMEFEKRLTMPQMKRDVNKMWMGLSDEAKEAFKRDKPQEYRALMEALKV